MNAFPFDNNIKLVKEVFQFRSLQQNYIGDHEYFSNFVI